MSEATTPLTRAACAMSSARRVVDAQLAYNFNEGSFKGLGVLLQVYNLTNEGYQTYAGTKDRPLEYIKWGKTVLLGANYKF